MTPCVLESEPQVCVVGRSAAHDWACTPLTCMAMQAIVPIAYCSGICIRSSVCRIAYATVPLLAAESAALAALECLYVRPNGLHLGVVEMSQLFGCTSSLLSVSY